MTASRFGRLKSATFGLKRHRLVITSAEAEQHPAQVTPFIRSPCPPEAQKPM
jgi:hypothetical protein